MGRMGLSWLPIRTARRTYSAYRIKAIRDFLIILDQNEKEMASGDSDYVYVFTDESYVNLNHSPKNLYLPDDESDGKISKKSGKGKRLIIFHAITVDGPLVDIDPATGKHADDLEWNRDTCHPKQKDGVLSCELM